LVNILWITIHIASLSVHNYKMQNKKQKRDWVPSESAHHSKQCGWKKDYFKLLTFSVVCITIQKKSTHNWCYNLFLVHGFLFRADHLQLCHTMRKSRKEQTKIIIEAQRCKWTFIRRLTIHANILIYKQTKGYAYITAPLPNTFIWLKINIP